MEVAYRDTKLLPGSKLLCRRCTRMTSTLEGLKELASRGGYKHLSVGEIHDMAYKGCPFCAILKRNHGRNSAPEASVRIFTGFPAPQDHEWEKERAEFERGRHPFEVAKLARLGSMVEDDTIDFKAIDSREYVEDLIRLGIISNLVPFVAPGDPAQAYANIKETYISVAGKEVFEDISKRLKLCLDSHLSCPRPIDKSLPTRVLSIQSESGEDCICLYVTQPEDVGQYLALSYRWGGPQEVTTTKLTLAKWKHGIPIGGLPLTLRDAIQVTRILGFKYLWVDALCIVQDDHTDMRNEISRMGSIYKNATLTIAAGNTKSVLESFLADRSIPESCTVPYLLPDGTYGSLWIHDGSPNRILSPLDSRAWTLQESLLSPRILWYGPADLMWKCNVDPFASVSKNHAHRFRYPISRHKRLPQSIYGLPEPRTEDTETQRSVIWSRIIEDYSGREMTFPEDRLPALAGIASELQKVWNDDYFAGMWRKFLLRHLGWYNATEDVIITTLDTNFLKLHVPIPHQYQSPGWTWTYYAGRVGVWDVINQHAEVLEYNVTLADESAPLSRVLDGKLVLNAACLTEDERLESNLEDSLFTWDYNNRVTQDYINKSFVYAFLGSTEKMGTLALILAPVGDESFMRIGILFGFKIENWKPESMVRRRIIII